MKTTITLLFVCIALTWSQASGIPDLKKGQGPAVRTAAKNDWFLHCDGCRGWAYRDAAGKSDDARQILITKIPAVSAVRRDLQVGDVILGVNGEPFSGPAIRQFRAVSHPAQRDQGEFTVLLWRKGWDRAQEFRLNSPQLASSDMNTGCMLGYGISTSIR